jgi:hypothetical protein
MELYEHIVLAYLTKDPFVFVSPQYSIRGDKGEWSCPDLVALNFREHRVAVVEVSTAWNPKSLREKVEKRDVQWIDRLRGQLRSLNVIDDSWTFEVQLYIRKDALQGFNPHIAAQGTPVKVKALEDLGPPWEWARG